MPPALLLLALASLIVASARPTAVMTLPLIEQTVILAMDVSGSMRATDVEPNRLVAVAERGQGLHRRAAELGARRRRVVRRHRRRSCSRRR